MLQINEIVNKYKNMHEGAKASIAFVICSILQKGIQLVTIPVFTRLLTTEQYGLYSLYQSWLSIITILATLNLSAGCFNNGMTRYPKDREKYISSMQGLTSLLAMVWILMAFLAPNKLGELLGLPSIVLYGMVFEIFFTPSITFWSMRERYEFRYKTLVLVTMVMALLNPIIGIFAVMSTDDKGVARCLSVSFINIIIGLFFYIYNFCKGRRFFVKEYWQFALKFNLPLIPHYLSQIVLAQSDRIMIENHFGSSPVGMYSVASNIGMIMSIVMTSVNSSFVPWTYERCKEEKFSDIGKVANGLLILIATITIIPIALAPEAIYILGSTQYMEAIWIVAPIAVSCFLTFIYCLFGNIEFYFEKSSWIMVASLIAAVLNVVLNAVCLPVFGYLAAGYTTVVCYAMLAVMHYVFMKKICREKKICVQIYDIKFVGAVLFLVILISALFIFSYTSYILRYMLIVVFVVIVFMKRRRFLGFLNFKSK